MSDRAYRRHHARRVKARVRQIARVTTNNNQDRLESLDRGRDYLGHCSPCHGRNHRGGQGSLTVQERRTTNIRNWQAEYEDAPRLLQFPSILGEEDREMACVKAEEGTKDSINVDLLLAELRLYASPKPCGFGRWQWDENDVSSFTDATAVLLRISRRKNAGPVVLQAIQAGADVDACDEDSGNTALMKAVANANVEVTRILIENGADVNARNKKGETPLMVAVKSCSPGDNTVPLLIENGADVDARDEKGRTALHHAAGGKCRAGVVGLLTKRGAELDMPDGKGLRPLHVAAQRGRLELVEALLTAGATSWIADNRGRMPIDIARYRHTRLSLARAMRARIRAYQV